jgi:peroxiredoxin
MIAKDGSFSFEIDVPTPMLVSLEFNRKKDILYIEPNDTLGVEFIPNDFPYSMLYSDKGGMNNVYLNKYFKEQAIELNQFNMIQFRHGVHWYIVSRSANDLMRSSPSEYYLEKANDRKNSALENLHLFSGSYSKGLSHTFINFLNTEIFYEWANHLLIYSTVYKNKFQIEDEFLSFLENVPLHNELIGSSNYRSFLYNYINYLFVKSGSTENDYIGIHNLASEKLSGEARAYVMSEAISKAINKNFSDLVIDDYDHFLRTNEYEDYNEKIVSIYQKYIQFAKGSLAPDFEIATVDGKAFRLSENLGKAIYLNFWASWCRPCMRKMRDQNDLLREFYGEELVVLNVALDHIAENHRSYVQLYDFVGLHALLPEGLKSELTKRYKVKALPQTYLIGPDGRFLENPTSFDVDSMKDLLIEAVAN